MRYREFWDLVDDVFGRAYGRSITGDQVLPPLQDRTAVQALDDGEEQLTVVITDDGVGLPAGFRPSLAGLGTRIVTSLASDLRGRIRWSSNEPHGTRVEFVARLRPLSR